MTSTRLFRAKTTEEVVIGTKERGECIDSSNTCLPKTNAGTRWNHLKISLKARNVMFTQMNASVGFKKFGE